MRVLVTTTSGTGHIYPVVPIARALRRAGHEVVWATAASSCPVVERLGFPARPAGVNPEERARRLFELHPDVLSLPPRDRRPIMFAGNFAEVAAPIMASDLSTIFDKIDPDLVVHEVAELGVTPIATSRGVKRVVVAFSGALPQPVLVAAAEAVGAVWDSFSLSVPADVGLYEQDYLHPFPVSLGQRPVASGVRDVRPVAAEGIDTIRDVEWLNRLGVDRPAVYVTYGTEMGSLAPWPALLGALASLDVDAIVTTGNTADLAPWLGQLDEASQSRIQVRGYVPQSAVLARASVVISHGGAGTMLAAGAAAVPQIVIPVGADQFDNADAFVAAGVAVVLDGRSLTSDAVAEERHRMLTNERVRGAANDLAEHFAAMPHPNDVVTKATSQ